MLTRNFNFKDAIFRVVAAILHLGNVNFIKGEDADSSKLRDDKSRYHLQTAAELLMYRRSLTLALELSAQFQW